MSRLPVLIAGWLAAACTPGLTGPDPNAPVDAAVVDVPVVVPIDARTFPDAATFDATSVFGDADLGGEDGGDCPEATCANPVDDGCGDQELCGPDLDGDGLDNDCDGLVDEGCVCRPGDVRPCFLGPPGRRGVGACQDGTQRCAGGGEFGTWAGCTGGISPSTEACDAVDNNCNGCLDDNRACCLGNVLTCPSQMPDGQPFQDYVIDGTRFYTGPVVRWSWSVTGGPCDELFLATSGRASYTLEGADTSMLTLSPTLSGDYTVSMSAVGQNGMTYGCTFVVHVRGPGMRVELCWDTHGRADLDLHLHRPGSTTDWFGRPATDAEPAVVEPDDCHYPNCRANVCCFPGVTAVDWGLEASPLSSCENGPNGASWQALGGCRNPRLDLDNISTVGLPENINVDAPADGETYRVMVHYYGQSGGVGGPLTHPMVNIYCGGHLRATYGAAPDLVGGFDTGKGWGQGPMWRVADITTEVRDGQTTNCAVEALHPPGSTSGYHVTQDDRSY